MHPWKRCAWLGVLMLASSALATIEDDLRTVLPFGPRVTGSAPNEQARTYFEAQFRALGYTTRREVFTYPRFDDLGSDVGVGAESLAGRALQGSTGGEVTARIVRIPGAGTPEDFKAVNVRGQVAVVQRGQISFVQKANNALAAGAAGLIVVNNEATALQGQLGERVALPALTVPSTADAALRGGQQVTLGVRVRDGEVRGVNVVAFKSGVTRPDILFGGHMDSVALAPGANDNLSGSVAVVDIARRVANTPLAARSYFVLFDGEEDGLRGSRVFVKDNPAVIGSLKAMFNFDMIGVNATPLNVTGEGRLVQLAQQAAQISGSPRQEGGSDQVPFAQAGIPTLFFHRGLDANYHQPGDTLADPRLIRATVDAALKTAEAALLNS
ncbi:M28 family peptidase [Deinococcus sp. QL22]|uniref:M28 family peptidase n=1 Tax=Deinococcus sp. QL22 TaxID=2939437 RepID=UPI00201797BB|nr:M28 family peptidase [Deinococcus sp. QL22]UQN09994.1 M28 family peptidase [Deinococcus sp. QL22]